MKRKNKYIDVLHFIIEIKHYLGYGEVYFLI